MKKRIIVLMAALLSGCAASRGFVSGTLGGPQYVDEVVTGNAVSGSAHTELKAAGYQTLMIVTAWSIWPVSAAAAGLSGIYGAYQFWKNEKKEEPKITNKEGSWIPTGAVVVPN